jgi:hypothetical protein
MNKKTTIIIAIQALLIIALFWMLVFYAKDEYEDYRIEQEEEIESADRVNKKDGISIISLSEAVQKNSDITVVQVKPMLFKGKISSYGSVVPIDALIHARAEYLSLSAKLHTARLISQENLAQHERLKNLNADDKNVSDRVVQKALMLANADQANINAYALQIKTLQSGMQLQWGTPLAQLLSHQKLPPYLNRLLNRSNVLVRASLPNNASTPRTGDTIKITPLNEATTPIKAQYISAAAQTDNEVLGRTFYYSAPGKFLRTGMRVNVEASAANSEATEGVIIPSDAVIWYAGKSWAYFKSGKTEFIRQPILAEIEVDAGWFNQGIDANSEVVVSGAQLLLSEEFKYLIKNENED